MQWWCAAQGVAWDWTWQPYPGVWIFILALFAGYVRLMRSGTAAAVAAAGERSRRHLPFGVAGVLLLWIALDWPVGPLGAGYLASVHMVQYLLIALVAPPLLLLGVPETVYARLEHRPRAYRVVGRMTHPPVALLAFILAAVVTHVPWVVDSLMSSQAGSFVLDMVWFVTGLQFWWPIVAPVPARPGFPPPFQVVYLFPAMLTHTAISVYLVFSRFPLYATYELAPPTGWLTAVEDQQVAGGLMWVAGTPIIWFVIAVVFFRWMNAEDRRAEAARA